MKNRSIRIGEPPSQREPLPNSSAASIIERINHRDNYGYETPDDVAPDDINERRLFVSFHDLTPIKIILPSDVFVVGCYVSKTTSVQARTEIVRSRVQRHFGAVCWRSKRIQFDCRSSRCWASATADRSCSNHQTLVRRSKFRRRRDLL